MKKMLGVILAAISMCPGVASGQSVKSEVTASNGVVVTVYSDEFARRYEYTAPSVRLSESGGFLLVSRVKSGGSLAPIRLIGSVFYSGEWRRYNSAIFRGGEIASSTFNDRDVVSCAGSRYSGCALREGFSITVTRDQIAKYSEGLTLQLQLQAQSGQNVLASIPVSYFEAISEISGAPSVASGPPAPKK